MSRDASPKCCLWLRGGHAAADATVGAGMGSVAEQLRIQHLAGPLIDYRRETVAIALDGLTIERSYINDIVTVTIRTPDGVEMIGTRRVGGEPRTVLSVRNQHHRVSIEWSRGSVGIARDDGEPVLLDDRETSREATARALSRAFSGIATNDPGRDVAMSHLAEQLRIGLSTPLPDHWRTLGTGGTTPNPPRQGEPACPQATAAFNSALAACLSFYSLGVIGLGLAGLGWVGAIP